MHMLRHQDVARDYETEAKARPLKLAFEGSVGNRIVQQRLPAITTEREKVKTPALLVTDKPCRHGGGSLLQLGRL
jgi:hypothetical protein